MAPTLGGALKEYMGFRRTADCIAVICLAYSIIFFIFNVGFSIFSSEKRIKIKTQVLKERLEEKEIMRRQRAFRKSSNIRDNDSEIDITLDEEDEAKLIEQRVNEMHKN